MPLPTSILSPALSRRQTIRKPSARSRGGIVVTQNRIASEIGARVLKEDGHAIDAAVAAAFAVGVVEPWMSGIGGVGAMLVRDAKSGAVTTYDFGPVSPRNLDPADYALSGGTSENIFGWPGVIGNRNVSGPYSVCTPTQPLGLARAHGRFGRKRWRELLAPAVAAAEHGLTVDWVAALYINSAINDLAADPGSRARFLRNGIVPMPSPAATPETVVRLAMPDLARTLSMLASEGAGAMYEGPLARAIVDDLGAMGGSLDLDDLTHARVVEGAPRAISYRDRTIHVLSELNGGPTLAVAWDALKKRARSPGQEPDVETFAAYANALKAAWMHRFEHLGDAGQRTAPTSTTHLAVVDRDGNMVTLTQTLLQLFGARVVLPKTGILLNNGMNWFDPEPGGPNSIAPGRRALANYAPAIMTGGDETIAIGGCGGRRIIPAVFQLLSMVADFGFDLDTALHTPRIDVSGTEHVTADRRLASEVVDRLAQEHDVILAEGVPYPFPFTIASAVARRGNENEGATEPSNPWSEAVSEDDV
jgi:gamma-glutamyltranspeptidase/glutathione hydrolase